MLLKCVLSLTLASDGKQSFDVISPLLLRILPLTYWEGVSPKFKGDFLGEGGLERRAFNRVSSTVL